MDTMDRFQAMQIFTCVVEANSFNKAAEALSMSPSSVTGNIKNLEALLGVRLLQRTTRRLNLTFEGTIYYETCRRILTQIAEAEAGFQTHSTQLHGALRVHMPAAIGRLVVLPALHEFHGRHPGVDLMISLGDRAVDLIQDGLDLLIRVGEIADCSFVARRIGEFHWLPCASPAYIARHGEPLTVEDLTRHRAVGYSYFGAGRIKEWDFLVDGRTVTIRMNGSLQVNDAECYLTCGLQGLGLIRPPSYVAQPYLDSGRLRAVLGPFKGPPVPLSIVYAHGRLVSPLARAFVEWLSQVVAKSSLLALPTARPAPLALAN
jgi:LysR family transcriptional regulator, regulator for bpeEF and oprC